VVDPLLRGILGMNVTYPKNLNEETFRTQYVGNYHQLTQPAHFRALHADIQTKMKQMGVKETGRVFYLSVPPKAFGDISREIHQHARPAETSFLKVIVEKPFGTNLQTAENLSREIFANLKESEVLLIDHYCGKMGLLGIPQFYKANPDYLAHVIVPDKIKDIIIHMVETEDVKGRTSFYEDVGVIRDTMQNHLTVMAQLVASSPPFTDKEKLVVLKAIPGKTHQIESIGQYVDYNVHVLEDLEKANEGKPADQQEQPHHVGGSVVPTYARVSFKMGRIHRLAGVKITFVSGKALKERRAFAQIRFKDGESLTFMVQGSLTVSDGTTVTGAAIYATKGLPEFNSKGLPKWLLSMKHKNRLLIAHETPNAYQVLLKEVLEGRFESFVKIPEVLEAWRIWTPVLLDITEGNSIPLIRYQHGGKGLDDPMNGGSEVIEDSSNEKQEL
jgi:hexose-6-phosphate dehydrogenase